jgi:hypothetical protein
LSHDGTFDTNAWVSLQYEIPNYRKKRLLRDRGVRERLLDPVVRANRIHTNIDTTNNYLALVNPTTGGAYNLMHVNPNATVPGGRYVRASICHDAAGEDSQQRGLRHYSHPAQR